MWRKIKKIARGTLFFDLFALIYIVQQNTVKKGVVKMAGKRNLMKRAAKPTDVKEIFQLFQQHNEAGNLAKQTIISYQWNCKHILEFLEEQGIDNIQDVTSDTVDEFKLHLVKGDRYKKISPTTRNTYLRNTRAFLYFAMKKEYLERFSINLFPQEEPIPKMYDREEIAKLIQVPDLKACKFPEYRNWVFVTYIFATGNRLRTAMNIRVRDIDFTENTVLLTTTKNREQQIIKLNKTMAAILREYLDTWEENFTPNSYLFPTIDGEKMSENGMKHTIAEYNRRRGVQKTSIHAMRHTYATNYMKSGGNREKLKQNLGHKDDTITNRYIHITGLDFPEDVEKTNILDQIGMGQKKKRFVR